VQCKGHINFYLKLQKLAQFSAILDLTMINRTSFYDIVNAYVRPAINDAFVEHMAVVRNACLSAAESNEVSEMKI
jgi:hypothetical protein